MPWNCRPKFGVCSLCVLASSGMATKNVVIGAVRISCESAGAAINVAAAAAALTATCLIPMVPLLNQGEARVAVKVLRALSTGAVRLWSGETVAALRRSGVRRRISFLRVGFFLEQLGARLERIFELGLGNEQHVVREKLLARQAHAQFLQALLVGAFSLGGR